MTNIAYQNKDITQKLSAELLKDKSLAVYGLPHIKIKDLLPTNLPAVEANELRLDNLSLIMDIGCMKLLVEPAFLINIPTQSVYENLKAKIHKKKLLTSEDLLQLIILPLTIQGKEGKQAMLQKTVELAENLPDNQQRIQALAGILTFSDKIIDSAYANHVKEMIRMNQVARLFMEEGALTKLLSQIRKKIARGWNVHDISDLFEEDESYIQKLVDLIRSHPDKDDSAICAIIFNEKYSQK